MRRLAPLLVLLTLAACAQPAPGELSTGSVGGMDGSAPVSPESLAKWASFPVGSDPRPLVLLGEPVNVEQGFTEGDAKAAFIDGRIDGDGKVPPEAADAFAKMAKPGAGEPKLKVVSVAKGQAMFATDRGPRSLPAWIFQLTGAMGPVTVLAVKPDYQMAAGMFNAKVSADGMTLTVTMGKAAEPCPGEPRITLVPERLESPTAVAVGLKQETGPVEPGQRGNCAHDMMLRLADYTIKLDKPLGNRVLVDGAGNPMAAISS